MNKFKYILLLLVGVFAITSCTEEEQDISTVTRFTPFEIGGLPSKIEVSEIDTVLVFNLTFDDNQIFDFDLEITPGDNSTATEDVDYALSSHEISVGALDKSASFEVEIGADKLTEGDESIFLTLTSTYAAGLPKSKTIEIVIKDKLDPSLVMTFDWGITEFDFQGNTYDGCDGMDLDFYIFDSGGNDTENYDAATGACPEEIAVLDQLTNGDYLIAMNNYENGLYGLGLDTVPFPVKVTLFKQGKLETSFVTKEYFTSFDPDFANDKKTNFIIVCGLNVTNGVFTVTDPDGVEIAKGLKPRKLKGQKN